MWEIRTKRRGTVYLGGDQETACNVWAEYGAEDGAQIFHDGKRSSPPKRPTPPAVEEEAVKALRSLGYAPAKAKEMVVGTRPRGPFRDAGVLLTAAIRQNG